VGLRPLVCFANPGTTQQFPVTNIRRSHLKDKPLTAMNRDIMRAQRQGVPQCALVG